MLCSTPQLIERLRRFAAAKGWTKTRLAREADINETTLRNFHRPDWNPTLKTIQAIEAIIPADFPADDPADTADSPTAVEASQ